MTCWPEKITYPFLKGRQDETLEPRRERWAYLPFKNLGSLSQGHVLCRLGLPNQPHISQLWPMISLSMDEPLTVAKHTTDGGGGHWLQLHVQQGKSMKPNQLLTDAFNTLNCASKLPYCVFLQANRSLAAILQMACSHCSYFKVPEDRFSSLCQHKYYIHRFLQSYLFSQH